MKTILVAPLNWGLGHATRCIPIIKELIAQNQNVILASDGHALNLLKEEFPNLKIIELPGYDIKYPKNDQMIVKIASQLPKILLTAFIEHRALTKIIKENNVAAIISDNRFGLFSRKIPSVFISHQLNILPSRKRDIVTSIVTKLNFTFISKFSECWIPDYEGEAGITGSLIHISPDIKYKYLGILSRFSAKKTNVKKKFKILVILSGPEPQRTILENILRHQLLELNYSTLFVRGITESNNVEQLGKIEIRDHCNSSFLQKAIEESEIIISRTGHTTVMDLIATEKRGLLIPTPGQPEQLYLGYMLAKRGYFFCTTQEKINLKEDIKQAKEFKQQIPRYDTNQYKIVIQNWLKEMR